MPSIARFEVFTGKHLEVSTGSEGFVIYNALSLRHKQIPKEFPATFRASKIRRWALSSLCFHH
jgi:hypothetical protein